MGLSRRVRHGSFTHPEQSDSVLFNSIEFALFFPVEQAVAGALRREQDLSLIIDELRQCLLRRTGAGEAAVEEVALRASLGGEGVDAQHDAGDRVA